MAAGDVIWGEISGVTAMQARIRTLLTTFPRAVGASQMRATEAVAQTVRSITPVDTGKLRNTVHAEGPFFQPDKSIETRIVAGGPEAPYGRIVHERLDLKHAPPTQAKFVEDPLKAFTPRAAAEVAAGVDMSRL